MRESILLWTANPDVSFPLLTIGALGLVWEFTAPGKVVPGAVGLLLFTLGAAADPWMALGVGAAVALFAAGAGFPSRGLAAAGATLAGWSAIRRGAAPVTVLPMLAVLTGISMRLLALAVRAKENKKSAR